MSDIQKTKTFTSVCLNFHVLSNDNSYFEASFILLTNQTNAIMKIMRTHDNRQNLISYFWKFLYELI